MPLLLLPLPAAAVIWTLANLLCCVWLPVATRRLSGVRVRDQMLAWLVALPFVLDNIVLGQSGVILLAAVTTALAMTTSGKAKSWWPIRLSNSMTIEVGFRGAWTPPRPLPLRRASACRSGFFILSDH